MSTENKFEHEYDILPPGPFARYMILHPGKDDETLECTLHTTSLDNMPDFEAISYVWGDPSREQVIICAQKRIYITANLRDALHFVRLPSRPRTLWADSICIHQADRNEQGHQVALMGQIYSKARATLVCLGKHDEGHAAQVDALVSRVNARIKELPLRARYNNENPLHLPLNDPLLSDPGWNSTEFLLHHPWFHRLWVVQEAAVAAKSVLLWGAREIDWVQFLWTVVYAAALAPSIVRGWSTWLPDLHCLRLNSNPDSLPQALRTFMKRYKFEVIDLLRQGRALGATDQRDRIYAVLGLVKMVFAYQQQFGITPDYSRPADAIFHDFAEKYLEVTKNIDLLTCVQHDEQSLLSQNPSWVPQWSNSSALVPSLRGFKQLTSQLDTISEPIILGGGKLRLRGVILDHVAVVSEPFDDDADKIKAQAAQTWNQLKISDLDSAYAPANQHLAFTWTLGGGKRTGGSMERERESEAQYLFELHQHGALFDGALLRDVEAWGQLDPSQDFAAMVSKKACDRRFLMTGRGYYGLGPRVAREGDLCCIIFGARVPFVLRKTNTEGHYQLVGDIYMTAETSNAGWSGWLGSKKGFTLLGRSNGKEWTAWGLTEQDIILC